MEHVGRGRNGGWGRKKWGCGDVAKNAGCGGFGGNGGCGGYQEMGVSGVGRNWKRGVQKEMLVWGQEET